MFAREFGFTPAQTIELPFHHRWALIEGHNKAVSELDPEGSSASATSEKPYYDDPRFPSATRGDVMASPEELMGLGIQYSRE